MTRAGQCPAPEHIRSKHEDRAEGEVRPGTVEQAIRQAHVILSAAGVRLAPSKVTRLCRDFLRTDPPSSFRAYLVRNAAPAARTLPLPRRGAVEWLDPTGDTAVHNVDPSPAVEVAHV